MDPEDTDEFVPAREELNELDRWVWDDFSHEQDGE